MREPAPPLGSGLTILTKGEVFEEQKIHDVTVWGEAHVHSDMQSLRKLLVEFPMAVVLLGGLVTSTMLNLLLLPALYGAVVRGRTRLNSTDANIPLR